MANYFTYESAEKPKVIKGGWSLSLDTDSSYDGGCVLRINDSSADFANIAIGDIDELIAALQKVKITHNNKINQLTSKKRIKKHK